MISFEFHLEKWHEKTQKPLWFLGFPNRYLFRFALLVAGEGCGCPVDTSVQSTEAPTEAAAETLNQFARLCRLHTQNIVVSHTAVSDTPCFCFFKHSLFPPPAAGALETPCHEPFGLITLSAKEKILPQDKKTRYSVRNTLFNWQVAPKKISICIGKFYSSNIS